MNRPLQQRRTPETPVPGARVLVIEARFHEVIADELAAGAIERLAEAVVEVERLSVPGALEIPVAAAIRTEAAMKGGKAFDGVVALGCVIRGETEHFEIVAHQSARGLMDVGIRQRIAIGNGILTVDTEEQAWARAKRSEGDVGGAAASAALALIRIARSAAR